LQKNYSGMKISNTLVFCDFDGTFAAKDIGHQIFKHFSGNRNESIVALWKEMKISSRECLTREAELVRMSRGDLESFLDQFELRRGAVEFYELLKRKDIPFYIVSDGTNLYIRYLLEKFGLEEIDFFSNSGSISDGRLTIDFPYNNYGCLRCGNCKGARIKDILEEVKEPKDIIFIGDGLSDICALPYANLIFARGDLLKYCHDNSVSAIEYQDFFDIINYMEKSGKITG